MGSSYRKTGGRFIVAFWEKICYWGLIVLLLFYLIGRAFLVPLVHDEAATFYHFVAFQKLIPGLQAQWIANNHILNSILTYISVKYLGNHEFALRLPNICAFFIYSVFTLRLSLKIRNQSLRWLLITSLILLHGVLEFFALSRGYGLMISFLVASIWYATEYVRLNKLKHLTLFLFTAILSFYANFTVLFPILCIYLLVAFYSLTSRNRNQIIALISSYILFSVLIIPGIIVLLELKSRGLLWYGGDIGFFNDSVISIQNLLFKTENLYLAIVWVILFVGVLLFLFLKLIQKGFKYRVGAQTIIPLTLVMTISLTIISNLLFEVKFPEDRTGLYLIPLFIIGTIISFDNTKIIPELAKTVFGLLGIALIIFQFYSKVNFTHSSLWQNERISPGFTQQMVRTQKNNINRITVGGYVIQELCWAYPSFEQDHDLPLMNFSDYPDTICDFQIVNTSDTNIWLGYTQFGFDSISNLSLLKRNEPLARENILAIIDTSRFEIKNEFTDLGKVNMTQFLNKNIAVEFRANIISLKDLRMWIVVEVKDVENGKILYRRIPFNWKRRRWEGQKFHELLTFQNLDTKSKTMNIYLWNLDKTPVSFIDLQCNLIELKSPLSKRYESTH